MDRLGRYQILRELGRGACGIVYSALDDSIGRKVAIKTIRTDQGRSGELYQRLKREARSAGILSHPNIVTVYELADEPSLGLTYIVMEYVDGLTLRDVMAKGEAGSYETVLSILRQAAEGLDFAHSQGIVHRDIKPANLMVSGRGVVKIADFGVAKILNSETTSLTQAGSMVGTAFYMSPEQIAAKDVDGRSDQFALAVIAYELFTGRMPFEGDSWASLLHQVLTVEPAPVHEANAVLPPALTVVLRKALAKDAANRYTSCAQFVADLAQAVSATAASVGSTIQLAEAKAVPFSADITQTVYSTPDAAVRQAGATERRSPKAALAATIGAVLAAAVLIGYLIRTPDRPETVVSEASSQAPAEAPAGTRPPALSPPETEPEPAPESALPQLPDSGATDGDQQPETSAAAAAAGVKTSLPPAPYAGPGKGKFIWTGVLEPAGTLTIDGSAPSIGSLSGAGLPPIVVELKIDPKDVQVIQEPGSGNRYRLILTNRGDRDVKKVTVNWSRADR